MTITFSSKTSVLMLKILAPWFSALAADQKLHRDQQCWAW
jgi:hypothetical protein